MSQSYDLERHPGMLIMSVLLLAMLIYFILDTFVFSPWQHTSLQPAFFMAGLGLMGGGLAWLSGRGAPGKERLGLAIALGAVFAMALWPASLRLNAIGAEDQRHTVAYESVEAGVYVPLEGEYPDVRFYGNRAFWETMEASPDFSITLVKGSLGFWQVYYQPIVDDIRLYRAIMAD
ncbi:hypothetical protein VCB98_12270 [Gammaproteobacteria bacterium AB-CW1]|uniref:Uncharacterized protein n=1 Tax=Natronospira elongata TaxID=3110268 RepID=A0AAP6MKZ5_9GAMM|nr:hypothetical protein [Gammaproteobacteria bacterium AB-CW1]